MESYEVIGNDGGKLGHVVAVEDGFVIAEEGTLRKKRHAIPQAFAHADDGEQVVRLTVSKSLVEDSPTLKNGELDRDAIAEHYGLGQPPPPDPDSSAELDGLRAGVEPAAQERVESREGHEPGVRGRPIIPPDPHDPL